MTTYINYADRFQKKISQQDNQQQQDQFAYIQFLEVQLEKVSQQIQIGQGMEKKIQNTESMCLEMKEKMNDLTKLVKLLQNFAEVQEEENNLLRDSQNENNNKIELLEKDIKGYLKKQIREMDVKQQLFEEKQENLIQQLGYDVAQDLKLFDQKISDPRIQATGSNQEAFQFFDQKLLEFREEINDKIQMVMIENQQNALQSDLVLMQKQFDKEKQERTKSLNQMEAELLKRDQFFNNVQDQILQRIEAIERQPFDKKSTFSVDEQNYLKFQNDIKQSINQIASNQQKEKQNFHQIIYENDQKMTIQLSKGIEKFGNILKKYVQIQTNQENRISKLESNIVQSLQQSFLKTDIYLQKEEKKKIEQEQRISDISSLHDEQQPNNLQKSQGELNEVLFQRSPKNKIVRQFEFSSSSEEEVKQKKMKKTVPKKIRTKSISSQSRSKSPLNDLKRSQSDSKLKNSLTYKLQQLRNQLTTHSKETAKLKNSIIEKKELSQQNLLQQQKNEKAQKLKQLLKKNQEMKGVYRVDNKQDLKKTKAPQMKSVKQTKI